ncbi:MAG TPA: FecR domain-containing protein [Steroidobacter sp.]|uniref:FecR family protein n=1 Tax=Steroidobacter sp. TaxID=1978227 RepID=UPI002ED77963
MSRFGWVITKDPYRPFIVGCGMATVRAIGTKFGVDCDQDVHVTVAEGTVTVTRGLGRSGQVPSVDYVRADAGQQVLVNLWTPLTPKDVDIKVELAWEQRRIIFRGTPIEEAISEFNRRHKQQIILPRVYDPKFKVFGEFDLEDPEQFIHVLKTSPALQPPR